MNKKSFRLTTAEFAKLHGVNKRTLHYYDSIGLFTPNTKGENKYRYYDSSQSIEFEYILMLKELNMSIDEIKAYLNHPNSVDFIRIVEQKTDEIERQITKLRRTKRLLQSKMEQLLLCERELERGIHLISCEQEELLTLPFHFQENELQELCYRIRDVWGMEQFRAGVGSFISIDKVRDRQFDAYDGIFTPALGKNRRKDVFIKPEGRYLCGYLKGTWDKIPELYREMLDYADAHKLELTGYAYETGMNDFAIGEEADSVTQIMIKARNKDAQ